MIFFSLPGVSLRFFNEIRKRMNKAEGAGSKITTPGKKRKRLSDDFDLGVLRRKVQEF